MVDNGWVHPIGYCNRAVKTRLQTRVDGAMNDQNQVRINLYLTRPPCLTLLERNMSRKLKKNNLKPNRHKEN